MAEKEETDIKVVVTARPEAPKDESVVHTPSGKSNIAIVSMGVWSQVGIRVLRTYLQGLVGFLIAVPIAVGTGAAVAVGVNIPVGDFGQLFLKAASLAVAPAVISALQNVIELLSKMDTGAPQFRA